MNKSNLRNPFPFLTDKIANLHGREVLRTPVHHCELNPIELIWPQVKGFVAENNTTFRLKDVKELVLTELQRKFGRRQKLLRPCIKDRKGVWERELH